MKFLCGSKAERMLAAALLCAVLLFPCAACASGKAVFEIIEGDCGGKTVNSTEGDAVLTASADGVNFEYIVWDDDTEHLYPRMQGKKLTTGWNEGGFWLIEFSSKGMTDLTFGAAMYSSGKGPRDFSLYYSLDGESYTAIENSAVTLTKTPAAVYADFPLPSDMENSEKVYLKIAVSSALSVKGKSIIGVKDGSTYINHIVIDGEYNSQSDPEPQNPEETDEKVYYKQSVNKELARLGTETGRYKYVVERNR